MADWYASSAAYAAIATFAISTAYTVGQIVKPTAPALKARWVYRVTTAGTSAGTEPAWPTANNSTVTSGGAVFTNVTGQSTYGWSAAAGDLPTLLGAVGVIRFVGGDRMFVSSDHAETQTAATNYGSPSATGGYNVAQVLSVNRAGSVPPVAADLTPGAICTGSGTSITISSGCSTYHYGMSYVCSGAVGIALAVSSDIKTTYLDACQLYLSAAGTSAARIFSQAAAPVILNNSTLRFSNAAHTIVANGGNLDLLWLNTPSAIAAGSTIPTTLFLGTAGRDTILVTARGVDLSAITTTLVQNSGAGKYLFDSCRIASGVTRYNFTAITNARDLVELVNCYDGTNILNESYQPAGVVTTERTITLSGGATDDVGTFSHRLVSNTNVDKYANPLVGFWLDIEQQAVGSSKTATVEIISSASLNNDEISLLLEYQGTSGSPVASFATTLPATVLTTAAAVTTSTATWNSSPATPVKQKLEVTFTPQLAGRVRGQVRLGKASTTAYYNPAIAIT